MIAPTTVRPLLPFQGREAHIPAALRARKRWAPWKAFWNAKRQKWDKIPYNARFPERRLSTANADNWFAYEDAIRAFESAQGSLHGIGYVMTGKHDIVGVDLDGCVEEGVVNEMATETIQRLGSYAELSPSGTGVRIFAFGEIEGDWTNHKVGIEVYQGDHPRFLTFTGHHLPGSPFELARPDRQVFNNLADAHREKPSAKKADTDQPMPMVLPATELPLLDDLDLPMSARDFLRDGDTGTNEDRSRLLLSTAAALFKAGLFDVQVFSLLVHNPYSYEVALDHRRQQNEKAEQYLWKHHVLAAKTLVVLSGGLLTDADFEDMLKLGLGVEEEGGDDAGSSSQGADDVEFEAVTDEDIAHAPSAPAKPKFKFKLTQVGEFARQMVTVDWLVKGVLPKAEMGVVYGASGSGKTFFVLDMLVHLAAGLDWNGCKVRMQRRIVYIAAEGATGLRLRVRAACQRLNLDPDTLPLQIIDGAPNMLDKDDTKALVLSIRGQFGKCDLLVADTLSQVTPGANENSSEDMGRALAHFKLAGKQLGAMVLMIGHTGKDDSRGQRGWSGIKGAMDVELEITRLATHRVATISKMKDGDGEGRTFRFELDIVNMAVWAEEDPLVGPELVEQSTCVCRFVVDAVEQAVLEQKEAEATQKAKAAKKEAKAPAVADTVIELRTVLEAQFIAGVPRPTKSGTMKEFCKLHMSRSTCKAGSAERVFRALFTDHADAVGKFCNFDDKNVWLIHPPNEGEVPLDA